MALNPSRQRESQNVVENNVQNSCRPSSDTQSSEHDGECRWTKWALLALAVFGFAGIVVLACCLCGSTPGSKVPEPKALESKAPESKAPESKAGVVFLPNMLLTSLYNNEPVWEKSDFATGPYPALRDLSQTDHATAKKEFEKSKVVVLGRNSEFLPQGWVDQFKRTFLQDNLELEEKFTTEEDDSWTYSDDFFQAWAKESQSGKITEVVRGITSSSKASPELPTFPLLFYIRHNGTEEGVLHKDSTCLGMCTDEKPHTGPRNPFTVLDQFRYTDRKRGSHVSFLFYNLIVKACSLGKISNFEGEEQQKKLNQLCAKGNLDQAGWKTKLLKRFVALQTKFGTVLFADKSNRENRHDFLLSKLPTDFRDEFMNFEVINLWTLLNPEEKNPQLAWITNQAVSEGKLKQNSRNHWSVTEEVLDGKKEWPTLHTFHEKDALVVFDSFKTMHAAVNMTPKKDQTRNSVEFRFFVAKPSLNFGKLLGGALELLFEKEYGISMSMA